MIEILERITMRTRRVLLVLILAFATIFHIYGLTRYNARLPEDVFGHILCLIPIICLITGLALVLFKSKG